LIEKERTMKKLIMIGLLMAFLGMTAVVMAHTEADPLVLDLIADGGDATTATDVGDIKVWNDATHLYVRYETDAEWPMTETHLHVALSPGAVPQKNGNPSPGKFDYSGDHDPAINGITYMIELEWAVGTNLVIAAHGVVGLCDLEDLEASLPEGAVTVAISHPGASSYFDLTITNGGVLNGDHAGWCADADNPIVPPITIDAGVYSTYDIALPAGIVNLPGNLDNLNWLLNHLEDYLGETSPSGGTYNIGDVQLAVWYLCDGYLPPASAAPWGTDEWGGSSDLRAGELVADALLLGEGFEPDCGELLGILLVPEEEDQQILLLTIPLREETMWGGESVELGGDDDSDENGYGIDFDGKNWAMYFWYEVQ
jgi:hypothetical protein